MYCSKCGAAIPQNAAFCASCGQPVNQPSTLAASAPGFATAIPLAAAPPYGYVASPAFPTMAYAGFWLRVVAYLIDGLLAGIGFGVLALIGVAMVGVGHFKDFAQGANNPDDFYTGRYWDSFCVGGRRGSDGMAVLRRDGELHLSRNAREDGARVNRDGSRWPTNLFWTRNRPLFFQAYYGIDSPRNRLRHGGIHGKEAGSARHDRELPGAAKSLSLWRLAG
jgi:hypothetical protein